VVEVQYGYVLVYADVSEDEDPRGRVGESERHDIIATRTGLALPVALPPGDSALVTVEIWDHAPEPTEGCVHQTVLEVGPGTRVLRIEELDGRAAGCLRLGHTTRWNARACQPPDTQAEPEWLIQLWPTSDQQRPDPNLLWGTPGG